MCVTTEFPMIIIFTEHAKTDANFDLVVLKTRPFLATTWYDAFAFIFMRSLLLNISYCYCIITLSHRSKVGAMTM